MTTIAIADRFRETDVNDVDAAHAMARLSEAAVTLEPFPHLTVRNFLPQNLFDALRAGFPSPATLGSVRERRNDSTYSEHRLAVQVPAPGDPETGAVEPVLKQTRAVFYAPAVVGELLNRFRRTVGPMLTRLKGDADGDHLDLGLSLELIYDRSGFELVPHTDGANKLVTGLLYVADPGDPPELGTSLYRPVDPEFRSDGRFTLARRYFEHVKTAPYGSNTLLAFGRSDQSFHGVEKTDCDVARRLLQFSISVYRGRPGPDPVSDRRQADGEAVVDDAR